MSEQSNSEGQPQVGSSELLADVMRYRRGIGRYNFSGIPMPEQSIAVIEAWEDLEARIEKHLMAEGIVVR